MANRNYTAFWDMDYLKKLPQKEREWIVKFYNEFYLGDFKGERINTNEKECYTRRNHERGDVMTWMADYKFVQEMKKREKEEECEK